MVSQQRTIPSNWPSDLVFLRTPCYSAGVDRARLASVRRRDDHTDTVARERNGVASALPTARSTKPLDPHSHTDEDETQTLPVISATVNMCPCQRVRIVEISMPSHPAYGQRGLFATQALAAGSFIICYLGWTHTEAEADPESSYDLSLDRDLDVAIDATHMGNEARFVNDYRGIRPQGPNAEFRDVMVRLEGKGPGRGQGLLERRVAVFVKPASKGKAKSKSKGPDRGKGIAESGIKKGEEIVVSYGKGFWKHQVEPEADKIANASNA